MNPNDTFTVIVRGVGFTLTRSQVEFDSPNYFTACFLGNFRESDTRTLKLSRDPVLFGIVFDYLCGYTVLPLKESIIPSRMSLATALVNLRVDAEFYQLDGLVQACNDQISPSKVFSEGQYWVLTAERPTYEYKGICTFLESFQNYRMTLVSKAEIHKGFSHVLAPRPCKDFDSIRELASIKKIVKQEWMHYDPSKWRIVGWYAPLRQDTSKLMIVLENVTAT